MTDSIIPTYKTTLEFSPPATSATWIIHQDKRQQTCETADYTYKLSAPSGWKFLSGVFLLWNSLKSISCQPKAFMFTPSDTSSTPVNYFGVNITITHITSEELTLSVTNQNKQGKDNDIYCGILLTVTDGRTLYTSPDPQIILEPRRVVSGT